MNDWVNICFLSKFPKKDFFTASPKSKKKFEKLPFSMTSVAYVKTTICFSTKRRKILKTFSRSKENQFWLSRMHYSPNVYFAKKNWKKALWSDFHVCLFHCLQSPLLCAFPFPFKKHKATSIVVRINIELNVRCHLCKYRFQNSNDLSYIITLEEPNYFIFSKFRLVYSYSLLPMLSEISLH